MQHSTSSLKVTIGQDHRWCQTLFATLASCGVLTHPWDSIEKESIMGKVWDKNMLPNSLMINLSAMSTKLLVTLMSADAAPTEYTE